MSAAGTALLDVNVLLALAWSSHEHHGRADRWFAECDRWSTTPITQMGFVRLLSNSAVTGASMSPPEACRLLADVVAQPGHTFWPDDLSGVVSPAIQGGAFHGYRQVTDAHLISLAHARGGRLATFDAKLRGLVAPGHDDLIEVIE